MKFNDYLTAHAFSVYAEDVQTLRASLGLRRDAERGVLVFRAVKPECPANREAWAALKGRNNTRVFCLPGKVQTLRRLTVAQESPGDRLYVCASKLAFITDAITQDKVRDFRMSEEGTAGLYYILAGIEKELNEIATEVN